MTIGRGYIDIDTRTGEQIYPPKREKTGKRFRIVRGKRSQVDLETLIGKHPAQIAIELLDTKFQILQMKRNYDKHGSNLWQFYLSIKAILRKDQLEKLNWVVNETIERAKRQSLKGKPRGGKSVYESYNIKIRRPI